MIFWKNEEMHVWWTTTQTARLHTSDLNVIDLDDFEKFCQQDQETESFCICNIDSLGISKSLAEVETDPRIQAILKEFSFVFEEPTSLPPSRPEDHQILLQNDNEVPPIRGIGRLDEEKLKVLKETLEKLLEKGYISTRHSPGINLKNMFSESASSETPKMLFCTPVGHFLRTNHLPTRRIFSDKSKTTCLKKTPLFNVKELQSFLCLINWFRDFIPDYATVALPLTSLLPKESVWKWGPQQQRSLA
jgi:hypothetical protein